FVNKNLPELPELPELPHLPTNQVLGLERNDLANLGGEIQRNYDFAPQPPILGENYKGIMISPPNPQFWGRNTKEL
ncbi:MAG: hypothetical protein AAFO04_29920, partial [Cyanobacteria bacterium J06592_8]